MKIDPKRATSRRTIADARRQLKLSHRCACAHSITSFDDNGILRTAPRLAGTQANLHRTGERLPSAMLSVSLLPHERGILTAPELSPAARYRQSAYPRREFGGALPISQQQPRPKSLRLTGKELVLSTGIYLVPHRHRPGASKPRLGVIRLGVTPQ